MKDDRAIKKTPIKGVYLIKPHTYRDKRGLFVEAFTISILEKAIGKRFKAKAWNHANTKAGVLRGLHAENTSKLLYPNKGKVFVAVVDIRPRSKTFGKHLTFVFSQTDPFSIFIEPGIAVGFCSADNKDVDYQYLMSNEYASLKPKGLLWNDPDVGIKWPLKKPKVSQRDRNNPTLRQLCPKKFKEIKK